MRTIILGAAGLVLFFSSCKKIISVDTENAPPQLVIEGNVTDRSGAQQIRISRTVSYQAESVYPAVSGAGVVVTDSNGGRFVFQESQPGLYTFNMRGVAGRTYTMQVNVDGKTYTAVSKMPVAVKLDSLSVINTSFFGKDRKVVAANFTDPATAENFYHFNLYVNDILSDRIYINNDRLTNGNRLRVQLYYQQNDEGLKTGDRIMVDMESVDSNIFDYWYALSSQTGRGPNQGTTPANPTSNIDHGALGYFSAHTSQRAGLVVP